MSDIKLIDVNFTVNGNNHCCFAEYGRWVDTKITKVGEGEDAEELFLGTVEVGTVIHCPTCGKNYILDKDGDFVWVDPEEFELVDAEEQPPLTVVLVEDVAPDSFGMKPKYELRN